MLLPFEETYKINSYAKEKWEDLLALIPNIERLNNRYKSLDAMADPIALNHQTYSQLESKFHKIVYNMEIVILFDWTKWKQGKALLQDEQANYGDLSLIELCKMITMIVRAELFNGGLIISLLADGTILKILKAIEIKVKENP